MNRRIFLASTGIAFGLIGRLPSNAAAKAPPLGNQAPGFYRFKRGEFEITALYDGLWNRPIDREFVRNAEFADVQEALARGFLPADKLPVPFTALVVNTGDKLVLLDTGTGGQIASSAGSFGDNLRAAGIHPRDIDLIAISHFHPDHINGIKTKDNALVFPNAAIMVPELEWAYWMDDGHLSRASNAARVQFRNARRVFGDIAKDVRRYRVGDEIAPGINAIAAHGHTPGHIVFLVSSGAKSMLVLGDTANHPALFVRHPDWQGSFDIDGDAAAATRKRLLDRAAADRMLVHGYHFPFPALGHIARAGTGYEFVPVMWQPNL